MALKGDRYELETTVDFFMNTTATRGGVVTLQTAGSGAALDQSAALVQYAANQSGAAAIGILLNDVVDIDQTRQHINYHKNEVQKGGKVTLLKKGYVVTNMIEPGDTIAAGQTAFVGASGFITNTQSATSAQHEQSNGAPIGQFDSIVDEDGFAKVSVNIPQSNPRNQNTTVA